MNQNNTKGHKDEDMRYVSINAVYSYQALKLIQAQMKCSADQMELIINSYFRDDLDEF